MTFRSADWIPRKAIYARFKPINPLTITLAIVFALHVTCNILTHQLVRWSAFLCVCRRQIRDCRPRRVRGDCFEIGTTENWRRRWPICRSLCTWSSLYGTLRMWRFHTALHIQIHHTEQPARYCGTELLNVVEVNYNNYVNRAQCRHDERPSALSLKFFIMGLCCPQTYMYNV